MTNILIRFFATGFGLGLVPIAPGTFGTVLGLILAYLFPDNFYLIAGIAVAGIWIAQEAEKVFGEHDSPKIVVDEIAGYLIAAYGWQGLNLVYAFILFRVLDILKPFPIRQLQRLPGGWGVMVDDLVAGVLANMILHFLVR